LACVFIENRGKPETDAKGGNLRIGKIAHFGVGNMRLVRFGYGFA